MLLTNPQKEIAKDTHRFRVVCCGRRFGKALALDTPILTTEGFKNLVDVTVDDFVFDEKGKPSRVLYKSDIYTGRNCYAVNFSDGTTIIADGKHDWLVEDKSYRKNIRRSGKVSLKKKTTEELSKNLRYLDNENNFSIPLALPVIHEKKDLPIEPYFLGLWLGDGTSGNCGITTADKEVIEYLQGYAHRLSMKVRKGGTGSASTYFITGDKGNNRSLQEKLRVLNVINNKHIPETYLLGSIEQRMELLMGLMDSDGYAGEGSNEYCTTSNILAIDMAKLLASLSIKSTIKEYDSKLYGRVVGRKYRLHFNTKTSVFKLRRKKDKQNIPNRDWCERRYITSVDEVRSVPVQCLMVDADSHLFLAGYNLVATHNTTLAIQEILGKAVYKTSRIAYIAPTYQQARDIAWSELKRILSPITLDVNESRLEIVVSNKQGDKSIIYLRGWESIETLRGQSFDFLVVDEIAMMKSWESKWNEVLRPTLTDRKGDALFISTPKGYNHFYDLFKKEKEDSDYKSFHYSSYDNPHLPKEEIEKAKVELSDESFHQEYLAEFHRSEGLVFKEFDRKVNVVEPFYIPQHWQRIRGFDYGSVDPTASVRIAVHENTWIVETCYKQTNRLIGDHAKEILAQDYGLGFIPIFGDPSGDQWEKEFAAHNIHIQSANKEVGVGMRGWVEHCIEKVNGMFRPIPGNTVHVEGREIQNCPALIILDTPENQMLIDEIERLSWKEDREGKNMPILEDTGDSVGHFDLVAALRYVAVSYQHIPEVKQDFSSWKIE